ncbi:MAG: Spi family protease inhibitor, partial [Candidatus Cloacimonadaceae bacterium]
MKKLLCLTLFILLLSLAFAAQISQTEALRVATDWMRQIAPANQISELRQVTNPVQNNQIDWYEVTFTEGGFVLISAEDKAVPILAYNPSGSLSSSLPPTNLQWFLSQYHEEISLIRADETLTAHDGWQALRSGDYSA